MNNATELDWDLSELINVLENRTSVTTAPTFFIKSHHRQQQQQQPHQRRNHHNSDKDNPNSNQINFNGQSNIALLNSLTNLSVFDEFQFFTNEFDDTGGAFNGTCCLSTPVTSSTSTAEPNFVKYFEALPNDRIGLLIFLMLFSFATVFGNSLVILAVIRERYLHTATNYFVTR
jgi:hypothetical protein